MFRPRAKHAAWILFLAIAGCSSSGSPTAPPIARVGESARAAVSRFRVLYSFQNGQGAQNPSASLTAVNGALYGPSSGGGIGYGTIYKVIPSASGATESVVTTFGKGPLYGEHPDAPLLFGSSGALYGMTDGGCRYNNNFPHGFGTVFRLALSQQSGSSHEHCVGPRQGFFSEAPLVEAGGRLYGTEHAGGSPKKDGVVFELRLSGSGYRVIHRFKGGADGAVPEAGLIEYKGTFYGTTESGGTSDMGTVYELRRSGRIYNERTVYSFAGGSDGRSPVAGLTELHGALYGTTANGGGNGCDYGWGCGIVFKLTPRASGYTETVVHRFTGSPDGSGPFAGLTELHGRLYGTTIAGGDTSCYKNEGCGTVFELTPSGSGYIERILHRFNGTTQGYRPIAGLTAMNDLLYGTTPNGGDLECGAGYGCGTVFSIEP